MKGWVLPPPKLRCVFDSNLPSPQAIDIWIDWRCPVFPWAIRRGNVEDCRILDRSCHRGLGRTFRKRVGDLICLQQSMPSDLMRRCGVRLASNSS